MEIEVNHEEQADALLGVGLFFVIKSFLRHLTPALNVHLIGERLPAQVG